MTSIKSIFLGKKANISLLFEWFSFQNKSFPCMLCICHFASAFYHCGNENKLKSILRCLRWLLFLVSQCPSSFEHAHTFFPLSCLSALSQILHTYTYNLKKSFRIKRVLVGLNSVLYKNTSTEQTIAHAIIRRNGGYVSEFFFRNYSIKFGGVFSL